MKTLSSSLTETRFVINTKQKKCAEILEGINGLHYWLDKHDECMRQAHAVSDDVQKSICIEQGLDASSALLGIIGPRTFDSPWIPYEIGGARGRQRLSQHFDTPLPVPHPLIAHLIHGVDKSEVPGFCRIGDTTHLAGRS